MQGTITKLTVNSNAMNNNFEFKDLLKITVFFFLVILKLPKRQKQNK